MIDDDDDDDDDALFLHFPPPGKALYCVGLSSQMFAAHAHRGGRFPLLSPLNDFADGQDASAINELESGRGLLYYYLPTVLLEKSSENSWFTFLSGTGEKRGEQTTLLTRHSC